MIFYESFDDLTGSVEGDGELIMVTAVPIEVDSIAVSTENPESEGVGESVATTEQAVLGVAATSANGLVPVQQDTRLRGTFTVQIDSGSAFDPGAYEFDYNFVAGRSKTIDGLTVRTLTSGSAPIVGTPLVLEIDPDVDRSQIILGAGGKGILRLSGRIVSTEVDGTVPFNLPVKFDLPLEQTAGGGFEIESAPGVALNVMANVEPAWFVDYDGNRSVDAADRAGFILDHAMQSPWTDLDGDGNLGTGDTQRFDADTAKAVARLAYLAAQGVQ